MGVSCLRSQKLTWYNFVLTAYLFWPTYVHCPLAQVIWGQCMTSFLPLLTVIPTVTSSPYPRQAVQRAEVACRSHAASYHLPTPWQEPVPADYQTTGYSSQACNSATGSSCETPGPRKWAPLGQNCRSTRRLFRAKSAATFQAVP